MHTLHICIYVYAANRPIFIKKLVLFKFTRKFSVRLIYSGINNCRMIPRVFFLAIGRQFQSQRLICSGSTCIPHCTCICGSKERYSSARCTSFPLHVPVPFCARYSANGPGKVTSQGRRLNNDRREERRANEGGNSPFRLVTSRSVSPSRTWRPATARNGMENARLWLTLSTLAVTVR